MSIGAGSERWSHLVLRICPDAVLRRVCPPVERFDRTLRDLAWDMRRLMLAHQGIGLAAPQAGVELRLFVCEIDERRLAIVNPKITARGRAMDATVEGCLSLPGVNVSVGRQTAVTVSGRDLRGKGVSFTAEGLWARVIQHELDHLNGRLISDYEGDEGVDGDTAA